VNNKGGNAGCCRWFFDTPHSWNDTESFDIELVVDIGHLHLLCTACCKVNSSLVNGLLLFLMVQSLTESNRH